jgi:hypothetical protein
VSEASYQEVLLAPFSLFGFLFDREDGGRMHLRNVREFLQNYNALHLKKLEFLNNDVVAPGTVT